MANGPSERVRRAHLADALRQEFEHTLSARVDRYLAARHHPLVGGTSFAPASSECIGLFRDGHFYGCISLCQAVGEALVRDMCRSNSWRPAADFEKNVSVLHQRGFIDDEFQLQCGALWHRRHDYHHLNATVPTELAALEAAALETIRALAKLEAWAFKFTIENGRVRPLRPQYWPKGDPGTLQTFLRFSP